MIRLAIIRHGRTAWNREGRIQGRRDIPLEADAVSELAALCLPREWQHATLISSPLARAVHTAELITGRAPDVIEPALIEMDYGEWEGLRSVDLGADQSSGFRHLPDWGWDYRPPRGESPADVWLRLEPWVKSLRTDTVAVCHIGVIRTLLAIAYEWPFKGTPPFSIKRNSLYHLEVTDTLTPAVPLRIRLEKGGTVQSRVT
ncbi:phosphoglycerate mutase [Chromatiales bacterium (ex Bugula neritina AB1)]|nr:phosphoglycerate mutase [Chromatiales bacterium (ex Bugula neritina AB1)]